MADQSLNAILNYLRQYNFERAEEALLSELQVREALSCSPSDSSESQGLAVRARNGSDAGAKSAVSQRSRSEEEEEEDEEEEDEVEEEEERRHEFLQTDNALPSFRNQGSESFASVSVTQWNESSQHQKPVESSMSASYDYSQQLLNFKGLPREHSNNTFDHRVQNEAGISLADSDKLCSARFQQRNEHGRGHPRTASVKLTASTNSSIQLHNENDECSPEQYEEASQFKNVTTGFSEKSYCDDNSKHFRSRLQGPDASNCPDSVYNVPLRNGWLDFCVPDDTDFNPVKANQCYPHPCEHTEGGIQMHQNKQAMKQCAKDRQSNGSHFVEDSTLRWQNGFSNSFEEPEDFLNSQPEELHSAIAEKSRYASQELALAKALDEGFEFDRMFHSDDQNEEFRAAILAKSTLAYKELGLSKGNNEGFEFDKMFHGDTQGYGNTAFDHGFNLGSFIEIAVGQLPGERHGNGLCKLPIDQSILQDSPELLSGFATLGDEPSDSGIGYPKHYWDSDTYDDDDDPGYHRQPIEDEVWFLAHEIDYPSEDERIVSNNDKEACHSPINQEVSGGLHDDEQSYLPGEQVHTADQTTGQDMLAHDIFNITNLFGKSSLNDVLTLKQIGNMSYDGQLMDAEELKLMGTEPVWQGFSSQKSVHKVEDIEKDLENKDSPSFSSPRTESYSAQHAEVSSAVGRTYGSNDAISAYTNEAVNMATIDEEDTTAAQEEFEQMKLQEDDFEVFNLRIVHRKNRTGFEEEKHFPVVINSVVAGRYLITEYLGSAAFSKAVQARDLQTGIDVCMKIIKNNKDFFDQSLDEIKLLKFINKHDPADSHHILRLYDYFYYREHLFLVCELLRANLYEFHKFNRESGGEAYFTMPRLQSIARQCLEALEFLHALGLIHCDLKPENILIKSYSRCEVKVIDLGSSCFQTDNLCSYVQSRSYRAPEVILGLPYDQKIDIWSLGCILAELCSGSVLFQNDSLATLLARVVGIIGPVMPDLISKGREAHKYFTKNFMLYERNQGTAKLEYLVPKKTSLRHRLPLGDQGFVDFVAYLLQINPENRPSASEALKHPWLTYPYEPILT